MCFLAYQKSELKMAGVKPEIPHISAFRWDRIEIPMAIPMFLRMRNSDVALRTLCDVSGSQKSITAADKPEIPISAGRLDRIEIATASDYFPL